MRRLSHQEGVIATETPLTVQHMLIYNLIPDQMRSQGALLIMPCLARALQDLDNTAGEEETNPDFRWLVG